MTGDVSSEDVSTQVAELLEQFSGPFDDSDDAYLELARCGFQLAEQAENKGAQAVFAMHLARMLARRGEYHEAIELAGSAVKILETTGDERSLAGLLNTLGICLNNTGQTLRALEVYRKSLDICLRIERDDAAAHVASNVGLSLTYLGNYEIALQFYRQSLDLWKKCENDAGQGNALVNLGIALTKLGEIETAQSYFGEAGEVFAASGNRAGLAASIANLARCRQKQGDLQEAESLARKAVETSIEAGDDFKLANTIDSLAEVLIEKGASEEARDLCQRSLKIYERLNVPRGVAVVRGCLARLNPDLDERIEALEACLEELRRLEFKPEAADALLSLSETEEARGNHQRALARFREHYELEREMLSERAESRAQSMRVLHELSEARNEARIERMKMVDLQRALDETEAQRERAEEETRQKTEFLRVVAHDFRNLSGLILSISDFIIELGPDFSRETDGDELIHSLHAAATDLHQSLIQVMDAGTLENGRVSIAPEQVDMSQFITRLHRIWCRRAKAKEQTVHLTCPEQSVAHVDPVHFRSVVENLVSNAIKYSPVGADISLTLENRPQDKQVIISVVDQGKGIPEDERHLLFRPFQRLSTKPTGGEISVGLGLFIVKQIVDMHGGTISVESTPGEGCTFSVTVPARPIDGEGEQPAGT